MEPFDNKVYLYKAEICVHYVYDTEFLGWKKYAKGGVEVLDVPGDHRSMLLPPNVEVFASILSKNLDEKTEGAIVRKMVTTGAIDANERGTGALYAAGLL